MLKFPEIDPVLFSIGPFSIRWYGFSYLLAFLGAYGITVWRAKIPKQTWSKELILDLVIYIAAGVIFGGSLGYWLFYHPLILLDEPWRWLMFWDPGRSFHGGLIGVLVAVLIFCRQHRRHFWDVTDFIAPAIPLGLAIGRLGNFMNGELWGRVTDAPWGMVFPHAGPLPRHPSQLYQFALEGVLLGAWLLYYGRKPRPRGIISAHFLVGYGIFRFVAELFREPDWHLGFLALDWMTMGQLLSIPMVLAGVALLWYSKRKKV